MFDYDKWQEIFHTIRQNKLRTFLTAFGVFWGIFMLVILMGSGKGLENGVTMGFSSWATNSGFVWSNKTTMPYKGFQPGRYVNFTNEDRELLLHNVKGIGYVAPRLNLHNWNSGNQVVRKNNAGAFRVFGDYPEYQHVQKEDVYQGRHINHLDIRDKRKVCVIGQNVYDVLFEKGENPIGEYIKIKGVFFRVVGVFKSLRTGDSAEYDNQTIYTPFTTFQQAYNFGNSVGWFAFTAKKGYNVAQVEDGIKKVLRDKHSVHPDDANAFGSNNLEKEFGQITGLFQGISIFVWIVGIGTLFAGIIGVSNIMLIIVKERTKEIGIRKSLGATPGSIISLIIQESIFLTAIAGYLGLALGNGLLIYIAGQLDSSNVNETMFYNPEINLNTAVTALLILIFSGALAGLIPATKAARINPIEALRTE